jgi:hypothetical protein
MFKSLEHSTFNEYLSQKETHKMEKENKLSDKTKGVFDLYKAGLSTTEIATQTNIDPQKVNLLLWRGMKHYNLINVKQYEQLSDSLKSLAEKVDSISIKLGDEVYHSTTGLYGKVVTISRDEKYITFVPTNNFNSEFKTPASTLQLTKIVRSELDVALQELNDNVEKLSNLLDKMNVD